MIYTLLAEGFEEIEALAVVDILRRADIEVKTVSVTSEKTVSGAHGINVVADISIGDIKEYDMLFLPGGYPGYVNLGNSKDVSNLIKEAYDNNKYIAAICAAPSILGKMRLLNDKTVCCFPGFEQDLMGADVKFNDVCVSGTIITSRGAGTAHKLGFKIVEIFKGKKTADTLAENMIYITH